MAVWYRLVEEKMMRSSVYSRHFLKVKTILFSRLDLMNNLDMLYHFPTTCTCNSFLKLMQHCWIFLKPSTHFYIHPVSQRIQPFSILKQFQICSLLPSHAYHSTYWPSLFLTSQLLQSFNWPPCFFLVSPISNPSSSRIPEPHFQSTDPYSSSV